jgi:hypothetical protein
MPAPYEDDSNNAASVYYYSDLTVLLTPPGLTYRNISVKSEPYSAWKLDDCYVSSETTLLHTSKYCNLLLVRKTDNLNLNFVQLQLEKHHFLNCGWLLKFLLSAHSNLLTTVQFTIKWEKSQEELSPPITPLLVIKIFIAVVNGPHSNEKLCTTHMINHSLTLHGELISKVTAIDQLYIFCHI